uniref:F-box and WD repeat domain containing 5 n=1 Tax=Rhinolophus ferrumequinum TaxID=59479 RepID=A0A671E440_RHIFE
MRGWAGGPNYQPGEERVLLKPPVLMPLGWADSQGQGATTLMGVSGHLLGPDGHIDPLELAAWIPGTLLTPFYPQIWNNDLTISLLHSADMRPYNWSYTQFSQFNQDDSLLLASGVFLGPHNSSSGEIVVISLGEDESGESWPAPLPTARPLPAPSHRPHPAACPAPAPRRQLRAAVPRAEQALRCVRLLAHGDQPDLGEPAPHRRHHLLLCALAQQRLSGAGGQALQGWFSPPRPGAHGPPPALPPQDVESENVNVVKRLFKIQNLNASTIRTVMVADCGRFDSPDLLLEAGSSGAAPSRVFDLGSDGEDEAAGPAPAPAPAHPKEGLRHFLDGLLDAGAQPQLAERALETKVAELLAQGRTKPPERSPAGAVDKLLIFTTGCLTYSPHQIGIKQILPHQMTTAGPVLGEGRGSDAFFDALDHVIDVHGHIIGMGLSPDNRYLYVNSRAWPSGSVVADPMQPPPIAEEIDLLVFDLKTMREVKRALRAHRAYTPNDECFFIFLDVSRDFVASGAEDRHGYIWDRHYNICLAKLRHQDVVNSVVFSPQEQELLLTASDDATIKAWRSPRTLRVCQAPRPRPRALFSWFASQRR